MTLKPDRRKRRPLGGGGGSPSCSINIKLLTAQFEIRFAELTGMIQNLETLISGALGKEVGRIDDVEEYLWKLPGNAEVRIRNLEKAIPDKLKGRLRCVEKKQALHWGWHAGIAAAAAAGVTAIILALWFFRVFG